MLRMVREDPLVAAGGLMKVSEGGLLEERLRLEERGQHRARPPQLCFHTALCLG